MNMQQFMVQKFIEQGINLSNPIIRHQAKLQYRNNPYILMAIDTIEKAQALEYNPSFKAINKQIDSLYKSTDWI